MPTPSPRITARLLDTLPALERRLLEVTAVSIVDLTRSQQASILGKLGCRGPRDRALRAADVDATREALAARGLLSSGHDVPVRRVGDDVTRLLRASGAYSATAEAVTAVCPLRCERVGYSSRSRWTARGFGHFVREIRIALFGEDWARALTLREAATLWSDGDDSWPLAKAALQPLDLAWLSKLPTKVAGPLLAELVERATEQLEPFEHLLPHAHQRLDSGDDSTLRQALAEALTLAGRFEEAARLCDGSAAATSLGALLLAIEGRYDDAVVRWEKALKMQRKETGKRTAYLVDLGAPFFPLALIAAGDLDRAAQIARAAERWDGPRAESAGCVERAIRVRRGGDVYWHDERLPDHPTAALVSLLARHAGERKLTKAHAAQATELARAAAAAGFQWLSTELAAASGAKTPPKPLGAPWLPALAPAPKWRRRLDALLAIAPAKAKTAAGPEPSASAERLAWFLEGDRGWITAQPKLQKRNKRGWTKGRNIALQRLHGQPETPELLSAHDRRALVHLHREISYSGRYAEETYDFTYPAIYEALVDHPLLFDGATGGRASITRIEPTAKVTAEGGMVRIEVEPTVSQSSDSLERTGDGRYRLVLFSDSQAELAKLIEAGLSVPASQRDDIAAATALLATAFPVTSSNPTESGGPTTEVRAGHWVRVLLELEGEGLAVQLRVRPWADGPALRPGAGGASVSHRRGDELVVAVRDLDAEQRSARDLVEACPTLGLAGNLLTSDGLVPDPVDALRVLDQLQAALDPEQIEWPAGRRWTLGEADDEALSLQIRMAGDWFAASGALAVDEELVVQLRELLRLQRRGRFLALGEDRFVALSAQMARHLDQLRQLAEESKGDGVRFHRLVLPALADTVAGLGAKTDRGWRARVAALSPDPAELEVPGTLRAELRPYQQDGYRWLVTLASWGAGACLADEMGLGKTVQALGLLARRGHRGPALVVAPTSVVRGWGREAARFTPALRACVFGPGDRAAEVSALGPRDVLLCSYGLLVTEQATLAGVRWSTVILDEAQALKNPVTARAKAACSLNAEARVALTGTPIENRALDLWSLFRFLNPGLLGSLKGFKDRFASPIERGSDPAVGAALAARVRPFVLRRTKTMVLPELPPKTERVLPVPLSEGEAALYEAIRQEALAAMTDQTDVLTVLGWLTRLRLACCHPALAGGDGLPSSKAAAFAELVAALRDGGHRALVFSQFVRHLDLVRAQLDDLGIRYQYLDGATPTADRQAAIDRFEGGEGELFLISLKAGGTGLNLTSADHVIHLDPWWNPAVEDQASDRVHRIGQRRPVTVYRLVAEGTVEEEIVSLHHRKRALAESLLTGTDASGRLSVADLVELLRLGAQTTAGG